MYLITLSEHDKYDIVCETLCAKLFFVSSALYEW